MKKWRWNKDKAFRNFVALATIVTTIMFIVKVATCGIAWISTTGYFG